MGEDATLWKSAGVLWEVLCCSLISCGLRTGCEEWCSQVPQKTADHSVTLLIHRLQRGQCRICQGKEKQKYVFEPLIVEDGKLIYKNGAD